MPRKFAAAQALHIILKKNAAEEDEEEDKLRGSELIPGGFWGGVSDVLLPGGSGGRRAGRATELAEASGTAWEDLPFTVKYPLVSNVLSGLGGAAVGALGGAGVGGALGGSRGAAPGAAIGAAAGSLVGPLAAGFRRRGNIRDIVDTYDSDVDAGRTDKHLDTPEQRYSTLAKFLLPLSGQWNAGAADARFARKNNSLPRYGLSQGLSDAAHIGGYAGVPGAPTLLGLAGGYGGHISAGMDREVEVDEEDEAESKRLSRLGVA